MEYANFAHPFLDRTVLGVLADYVTMDQGTGVVHTAPSHGADDFDTGVKYKLDRLPTWTPPASCATACPNTTARKFSRRTQPIVELLKTRGVLMHSEKLEHSYPHCWRCHNPDHLPRHRAVVHLHGNADGRRGTLRSRARSTKSKK